MPEIRLESLIKHSSAFQVLHGINLGMLKNEFSVLVWLSGCGRSTILRMIAELEAVSEGQIFSETVSILIVNNMSEFNFEWGGIIAPYYLYTVCIPENHHRHDRWRSKRLNQ
jgi:ABC-type polar amino acid transport system ATPase subunit